MPPLRVGVPLVAGVSAFDLPPRLAPGLGSLAKVPGALLAPPDGWRLHMPTVVLLGGVSAILPMALSARAYLVEWGVPTEEPARQGLFLYVDELPTADRVLLAGVVPCAMVLSGAAVFAEGAALCRSRTRLQFALERSRAARGRPTSAAFTLTLQPFTLCTML